jgi:hypothetical protein
LPRAKKGNSRSDLENSPTSKKETITLALDKNILDDIRKSAKDDGLSVNALMNSILSKWVNFFKYQLEYSVITLSSQNFESLLEKTDEEVFVREFSRNALGIVRATLIARNIPLTVDNLIEYEYKTFGVLGGAFQSVTSYKDPEGHTCIVFKQRYGEKWSRVIARVFGEQLETLFKCHVDSSISPNAIILKILETNIGTQVDH